MVTKCVHYWQLNFSNGDGIVYARCKNCLAERLLSNSEFIKVDSTIHYRTRRPINIKARARELDSQKEEIVKAWVECDYNVVKAAERLRMSAATLYGKLYQWGLKRRLKERTCLTDELSLLLRARRRGLAHANSDRRDVMEADILALARVRELIRNKS